MNPEETAQAMELWRRLRTERLRTNDSEAAPASLSGRRARWLAMIERAQPWLSPSAEGLIGETREIVRQWMPAWTRDLKSSPSWEAAKRELAAIRRMIAGGQLEDADWQIRDIFIRCVPAARKICLSGFGVRAVRPELTRHESAEKPHATDAPSDHSASALAQILDWLEAI